MLLIFGLFGLPSLFFLLNAELELLDLLAEIVFTLFKGLDLLEIGCALGFETPRLAKFIITAVHPIRSLLPHSHLIKEVLGGAAPATVLSRLVAPLATKALALGAHSAPLLLVPWLGGMVLSLLEDGVDLGHW